MKRLFIIVFAILALLFFSGKIQAEEVKFVQRTYIVQVVPVFEARIYQVTSESSQPPRTLPAPMKPNFRTPVRDSIWWNTYYWNLWNYNRFGRRLGQPPAIPGHTE